MYEYLPNVAGVSGVSMPPKAQKDAQADAPAQTPIATPAAKASSDATGAPAQAPEARGPDTGFLHKEASLARRARAQIISAEPKPTTRGWRMAVERLTDTLQQMERAIATAHVKPPTSSPGPAPMPALDVVKSADRMAAFYEEQDTVQPHPSTSETAMAISALAQVSAPAAARNAAKSAEAAPAANPFVEREERAAARAAAETEDGSKQLLTMALSGYAQPAVDPEKPGDR